MRIRQIFNPFYLTKVVWLPLEINIKLFMYLDMFKLLKKGQMLAKNVISSIAT